MFYHSTHVAMGYALFPWKRRINVLTCTAAAAYRNGCQTKRNAGGPHGEGGAGNRRKHGYWLRDLQGACPDGSARHHCLQVGTEGHRGEGVGLGHFLNGCPL